MSYKKMLEIANKIAKTMILDTNNEFKAQEVKLQDFYATLMRNTKAVLSEMEGDILTLKLKDFDKNTLKEMITFWEKLYQIYHSFEREHPYKGAQELISFVNERMNKATIDTLNVLINHHLKKTKIQTNEDSKLKNAEVHSLHELMHLTERLNNYIKNNTLLPDPRLFETVRPKRVVNE